MYRKSTAGVMSNNNIAYNRLVNKKTKNITYVTENKDDIMKVNCNHLYKYSVSNKTKKAFNNREKFYRITDDDMDY